MIRIRLNNNRLILCTALVFSAALLVPLAAAADTSPYVYYKNAVRLQKENKIQEAVAQFFTALENPHSSLHISPVEKNKIKTYLLTIAESLYKQQKYDDAAQILNPLLGYFSDWHILELLGDLEYHQQNYAQAIAHYTRLLSTPAAAMGLTGTAQQTIIQRILLYIRNLYIREEFKQAQALMKKIDGRIDSPELLVLQGLTELQLGNADTALPLLISRINAADPRTAAGKQQVNQIKLTILQYAQELYNTKKYHLAKKILDTVREIFPEANTFTLLGYIEFRLNNFARATDYFDRALTLKPDNTAAVKGKESVKLAQQDYKKALKFEDLNNRFNEAEELFASREYQLARAMYEKIIAEFPDRQLPRINQAKRRIEEIQRLSKKHEISVILNRLNASAESNFTLRKKLYLELFKLFPERLTFRSDCANYIIAYSRQSNNEENISRDLLLFFYDTIAPISEEPQYALISNYFDALLEKDYINSAEFIIAEARRRNIHHKQIDRLAQELESAMSPLYTLIIIGILALAVIMYILKKTDTRRIALEVSARYYRMINDFTALADRYRTLISLYPNDASPYLTALLQVYHETKHFHQLMALYESVKDRSLSLPPGVLLSLADLYIKKERYAEAQELLNKCDITLLTQSQIKKLEKKKFTVNRGTGNIQEINALTDKIIQDRFDPAVIKASITANIENGAEPRAVELIHTWIHHQPAEIEPIVQFLKTLTTDHPETFTVKRLLAALYKKLNMIDTALPLYQEVLSHHRNKLPLYTAILSILLRQENYTDAYTIQKEIMELRTDNLDDEINLAEICFSLQDYQAAAETYITVLEKDRDNLRAVAVLQSIAEIEYQNNNLDQALRIYEEIIRWSYNDTSEIKLNLGRIYIALNQAEEAIKVLQSLQSGDLNIRYRAALLLGKAMILRKDYTLAITTFDSIDINALALNADVKKLIYYSKGRAYEEMQMYEDALRHYHDLILIDFNYKDGKDRHAALKKLLSENKRS